MTLYASYAGLRSQRRTGNPLWDLTCRIKRGDDPGLFASILSGPEAWREVPWITEAWVDGMRRLYVTVPSKFQRLVCNEWATSESAFITTEELAAAIDHTATTEPLGGASGNRYTIGVDIGLTHDGPPWCWATPTSRGDSWWTWPARGAALAMPP